MTMIRNGKISFFIALCFSPVLSVSAAEPADAEQLFKQKCAFCHAINKKKLGPAVNTMSKEKEVLRQTIIRGRNSMPGFEGKLTGEQINVLVDYLLMNQKGS